MHCKKKTLDRADQTALYSLRTRLAGGGVYLSRVVSVRTQDAHDHLWAVEKMKGFSMSKRRDLATICLCLLSFQAYGDTPSVSFDHTAGDQITTVKAEPGDAITVTIQNTCPTLFSYSNIQQKEPQPKSKEGARAAPSCSDSDNDKISEKNIASKFEAVI